MNVNRAIGKGEGEHSCQYEESHWERGREMGVETEDGKERNFPRTSKAEMNPGTTTKEWRSGWRCCGCKESRGANGVNGAVGADVRGAIGQRKEE